MTDYWERQIQTLSCLSDDKNVVSVEWSRSKGIFLYIQGNEQSFRIAGPLSQNAAEVLAIALRRAITDVFSS
mgnify:CR=1 FL=1|jgi:hypothetical protein